jgi:hypothetical protein
VEEDTHCRDIEAKVSLNKYGNCKLQQKICFLKSHVFLFLVYAAEGGHHSQLELELLDVFINE